MSKKRLSSSIRPPPRAERPPPSDGRPKNRLLAALPTEDFDRLRPLLTTIPVRVKQVLQTSGAPLHAVYFLNGGVASITTALSDGTTVEAATVGDEGMLGVEAFLSADVLAPGETLIQVPDTSAEMMGVDDFRREVAKPGAFRDLVGRYTQVVIAQMMQSTACNALCPSADTELVYGSAIDNAAKVFLQFADVSPVIGQHHPTRLNRLSNLRV